jgi:hypothetical protein
MCVIKICCENGVFLAHLTQRSGELLPSLCIRLLSMSPAGGHLGFSIGPKSNNTWLAACNDHSDNFQFQNFSQSEAFMALGSHVG